MVLRLASVAGAALTRFMRASPHCQVKAERSTVTVETMTEFTIKRNREQNHDPIIAEEEAAAEAAAAKEPQDRTTG